MLIAGASTSALVSLLDDASSWHRETAARLLYERQDKSARTALELLASRGARPQGRVLALFALDGLGELSPDVVLKAMTDADSSVRAAGVQLGKRWLTAHPPVRASYSKWRSQSPRVACASRSHWRSAT